MTKSFFYHTNRQGLCLLVCVFLVPLLAGCTSLDRLVRESDFNNVLGMRVHSVGILRFPGFNIGATGSYYLDTGTRVSVDKSTRLLVLQTSKGGTRIRLYSMGRDKIFDLRQVGLIQERFLSVISEYLPATDFDIQYTMVPLPNSYSFSRYRFFKSVIPVALVFPVRESQSFIEFSTDALPSLAHELFHLALRLSERRNNMSVPRDLEKEVLAHLFSVCVEYSVFGSTTSLQDDLLPENFVSASSSPGDDKAKLDYIRQYAEGGKVHKSYAGKLAIYFYLFSGFEALQEERSLRFGEICARVFKENQYALVLDEIQSVLYREG